MRGFDVVVVGSLNLDLVTRTERLPGPGETVIGGSYAEFPGGKGLNQAVAAARAGASVALVGAVGGDHAGALLRGVATDEGIDVSHLVTIDDEPTGRAIISVDEAGENSIIVVPGANARVAPRDIPVGRVVIAQLEIPLGTVAAAFRLARGRGATTVLNPAPAAELAAEFLASCDIVVPNEHEVVLLGGTDRLLDHGVSQIVVTRGGAGVDVVTRPSSIHLDAFPVDPVDTTGAGDAFCGALASRLAAGDPLLAAVQFAAAAGALATTKPGAVPSQARRSDIEALAATRTPAT
ncbi:MAG: ribokinase [Ilumatobacteraceae bacterium]|nr:ribokinase [Ilumatobacteraceae bacterium]